MFDSIAKLLALYSKQNMSHYSSLETADDNYSFADSNGSLMSVIKIHGNICLTGDEEFNMMLRRLNIAFKPYLSNSSHKFQFVFTRDPENSKRVVTEALKGSALTAKRLDFDINDVLVERVNLMAHHCADETLYLSLWTNGSGISKEDRDRYHKKLKIKTKDLPLISEGQNPMLANTLLRDKHASFVQGFIDDLKAINLRVNLLDVHTAARAIRFQVDYDFTDYNWNASLPGDPLPMGIPDSDNSIDNIIWPKLSGQLFSRDGFIADDYSNVKVGNTYYAPMFMEIGPQDVRSFNELFARIANADYHLPWRISFFIDGNPLSSLSLKRAMAGILSFAHHDNKLINSAMQDISSELDRGITHAKLRISFITWAKDEQTLEMRRSTLATSIQGWGKCDVAEERGDPFAGFASTVLGLIDDSIAEPHAANVPDVIKMLPLVRATSPWDSGAVLFKTLSGKLWPYQPGSSKQITWIDLMFAKPGSGKSVLSNTINLGLIMAPGNETVPYVSIIDIGPSSSGLISLVKDALPKHQKHYAIYVRLQMTKEYAINAFDTQLGARKPMPSEMSFLKNFVTLLVTPVGKDSPYEGMPEMIGQIIEQAYINFEDNLNPNVYVKGMCEDVDNAIAPLNVDLDHETTWWEVADLLFENDYIRESSLAQRYAVPTLQDLTSVARNTASIKDTFGPVTIQATGESIIDVFTRMISTSIRDYPILSSITKFDLGDARIVSLDLDDVAKTGGDSADRQTAVMYMLAMYIQTKNFHINKDLIDFFNPLYREYQLNRVEEIHKTPKRLCLDEFHRTKSASIVRDQVVVEMREGRKWNIQVALASQSVDDFDENMIEFATNTYIFSPGSGSIIDKLCKKFGFGETERYSLENQTHGPGRNGVTFLYRVETKNEGTKSHIVTSLVGPVELWAFSTTQEDVRIRTGLSDKIGAKAARKVLAINYPGGSAKEDFEKRKTKLSSDSELNNKKIDIIGEIVDELVKYSSSNGVY